MIGFLLSLLCFLLTIPLKTVLLGLKLKTKGRTLYDRISQKKSNLLNRLNIADNSNTNDENSSVKERMKQKAIQTLKASLHLLILFLRFLGILFSILGTFGILLILILGIILVAAMGGIVSLLLEQDGSIVDLDATKKTAQVQDASSTAEGPRSTVTQRYTDNSSWQACCSTMLDWYVINVPTYQKSLPPNKGTGERGSYTCELLDMKGAGDDCSAFVGACLYYAGFSGKGAVPSWGSATYKVGNETLRQWFNEYHYADFVSGAYIPRPGDIVAVNNANHHHVEVIAKIEEGSQIYAYGWGSVRPNNPRGTGFKTLSSYMQRYETYWSLKDDVIPPSYLEGKETKKVESSH